MARHAAKGRSVKLFDLGGTGEEHVHDRVLTVPNVITAVRLAGLPVFVWLVLGAEALAAAFALLVLIGATDWVDGYVARRFDQVSRLGTFIDPLVDRVLVVTVAVTLTVAGLLPVAVVLAVALRDVLVVGGALVLFRGIPPIAVTRTGKTATALLLAGLPLILVAGMLESGTLWVVALSLIVAGLAAYYGAGVQYARAALALRSEG